MSRFSDGRFEIKGAVCLVTGGARGMGRLWAEQFAGDGARIILWDRDASALEKSATEMTRNGVEVFTQVVDVTDSKAVRRGAEASLAHWGQVDVLVNNAGIVHGSPFHEATYGQISLTVDVNLKGMMYATRALLESMIERNEGLILNIGSASGFIGVPLLSVYAGTKWAVIGFTESLRLEMKTLGHKGVRFAVFCPSYVDTGMFAGVKAPRLVPLLAPKEAVKRGYRALKKGEFIIKEPFVVKFTPGLRALLPQPVFDKVNDLLGVYKSMATWEGRKQQR